jgi:hypothetical protein
VVVEEFLDGEEASFFALVDGPNAVALASAQDHKAVGDGDTGPNTGGMGAYSPAPVVTPDIEAQVGKQHGGLVSGMGLLYCLTLPAARACSKLLPANSVFAKLLCR